MSRKMKGFADYFMQGLQMGGQWANQWEARAIERERSKLKSQADAVRNAREDKKLALYGHGVMANAELARARAANVGKTKGGGGGGGAAATSADTAALLKEANDRNIIVSPTPAPAQTNITVTGGGNGDGGGIPDVPQPPGDGGGGTTDDFEDGGVVGRVRRYAEGGIVEGMSLQEAAGYSPEFTPSSKPKQSAAPSGGGSALGGAMIKNVYAGVDAYKKARDKGKEVKPTGPQGSGEGGKYTVADSQPGGALSTEVPPVYRAGGTVRRPPRRDPNIVREPAEDDRGPDRPENDTGDLGNFSRGGRVGWYAEGGKVRHSSEEPTIIEPKATPGMASAPVGRGRASLGATYDPSSRYGAVEGGYEHPVGKRTTLGVHGNVGKDIGPEGANARPDWGVGIRGRMRFAEGGMVGGEDLTQGYDWKAAEKERDTQTQQQQTEQVAQQAQQKEEEETKRKRSAGDTGGLGGSSGMNFDFGSADGATGSGGDSTGGVSGTGGVGGSATDGSGGSAAAGTSGDAGSDGGGTYRRGGQVRRFQSGGRVMREQAIDTGTSGPGSGYGYRAAPPSRRY